MTEPFLPLGGCPFCGKQTCVAGECKTNPNNLDINQILQNSLEEPKKTIEPVYVQYGTSYDDNCES